MAIHVEEDDFSNINIFDSEAFNIVKHSTVITMTKADMEHDKKRQSEKNTVYIISDYSTDADGIQHPGVKFGDGSAYIIDLPYASGYSTDIINRLKEHASDQTIHITQAEREFWNQKVNVEDTVQKENLIFTRK